MGQLTPSFLYNVEKRMQVLTESEYSRLQNGLWWRNVATVRPSQSAKEVLMWLLSTAMIREQGQGGNMRFDDLVSTYTEVEAKDAGDGLELRKNMFEDISANGIPGGAGMDAAARWSRDIGAYMGYWPQKRTAYFLKNGHTASLFTGYDGKAYFASDHPVNPFKSSAGIYQNILTGAASGVYPGACPIDESVSAEIALKNLGKVMAYIASIPMPNGEDPRHLRPKAILCGPQLHLRASLILSADYLAFAAAGGAGGSADVRGYKAAMGYGEPIRADELAGFESDTSYFVICEQAAESELGGAIYVDREPFRINYYGNVDTAELNRKRTLEWHCNGRNAISAGHPYLIFKVKGS